MGLDSSVIKFLCGARSKGIDFSRVATVGRQWFMASVDDLREVLSVLGAERNAEELVRDNKFGEFFFELLGAKEVASVDVSNYEDATIIHDMNRPISDDYHKKFTVVLDGGSLEHIFNVPQALANCMEMVEVGGHYMLVTAGNNSLGHGFWQISPELIFRVFSPANGFQVEVVLLKEVLGRRWHTVRDPEEMRRRVELCNSSPTYICCLARRVATKEIFAVTPQQSDYVAIWDVSQGGHSPPSRSSNSLRGMARALPSGVRRTLKQILKSPYDPACYKRIAEADILRGRWS